MRKVEQLYNGEQVSFSMSDLLILNKIISALKLKCFPNFITNFDKSCNFNDFGRYTLFIDKNSFIKFLQTVIPKEFSITTKKSEYKCNFYGVASSNTIFNQIKENANVNKYIYDFEDENNEFQLVCDFFNYNSIIIQPQNFQLLKKISQDLQIVCLSELIDKLVNDYMFNVQIINKERPNINTITQLFEYLYNRKKLKIEIINELIVSSKWSQTTENVEELAACIIQVIYSDASLHPFLFDLMMLLDKSYSENNQLNILLPFLTKSLLNNIGCNLLNCSFIYLLNQKSIISKEDIVEQIHKSIQCNKCSKLLSPNHNMFMPTFSYQNNDNNNNYFNKEWLNNSIIWFFPELIEIKKYSFNQLIESICFWNRGRLKEFIRKYYPDNIDGFKKMRESGEPDDELALALRHDDVNKLKSFSGQYIVVPFNMFESFIYNGNTDLIKYSAAYGSVNCFKYLLSIKPNSISNNMRPYAIFGQNKEIIELVYQAIKPSTENNWQSSSLTLDIINPIIPIILKHQNDIFDYFFTHNFDTFNYSALLFVVKSGNIDLLIKLIDKGLKLASIKKDSIKELVQISSTFGYYELTKLLFELIFNENNPQFLNDPFQILDLKDSVHSGNLSIFKLYTLFNIKEHDIEYALINAIIREHTDIIKYMFETEFRQKFKITFQMALLLIKSSFFNSKTDIFHYLVKQFVDIEHILPYFPINYDDDSLLRNACLIGNIEIVKIISELLLKKNSKVVCTNSISDSFSSDIVRVLIEKNVCYDFECLYFSMIDSLNIETVSLLWDHANHSVIESFKKNILIDAIRKQNKDIVKFLLEKGVAYDNALFEATSYSDIEIVKIIIDHDSSPSFINKISEKGTALNIAVSSNKKEIVELLLSVQGINPSLYYESHKAPLITAIEKNNIDLINLILDFYGDNIQSEAWQLNEILHKYTFSFFFHSENIKLLERILKTNIVDLNYHNDKYTLLTYACQKNWNEIFSFLINSDRCDVNLCQQSDGNTALMVAIESYQIQMANLLVNSPRTDINLRNHNNETALTIAVKRSFFKIVDLIINNEKFDPKKSRLDYAFSIANSEIAKKMIKIKDLNVNYKYSYNDEQRKYINFGFYSHGTSLTQAVADNNFEKVEMIIQHPGFDPIQSQVNLAIFVAVSYNYVDIFNRLLPLINNDINIYSPKDESLLVVASRSFAKDIIHQIITSPNFDVSKSQIDKAFMSLFQNSAFNKTIITDIAEELYEIDQQHSKLIDFTTLLPNGKSFFTGTYNSKNYFQYLVKHNANPDLPDINGKYPLQIAIESSDIDAFNALINSGKVDLTRRFQFERVTTTYLHLAAMADKSNILKRILDLNVISVNEIDSNGDTPLIYAIKKASKENIEVLFERDDLDFAHINYTGEDAIDVAKKKKYSSQSNLSFNKPASKRIYLDNLLSLCDSIYR
ncbi:hypothetical protein M9Y10_032106 [Tritrichomonas musculus]|uniref:DUF3447 domain-containing protein n=1 Tax=Tritrichomonas musculus TaxID=1915356 RepID=A0ABR2GZ15_9EUKA